MNCLIYLSIQCENKVRTISNALCDHSCDFDTCTKNFTKGWFGILTFWFYFHYK